MAQRTQDTGHSGPRAALHRHQRHLPTGPVLSPNTAARWGHATERMGFYFYFTAM